jgi:general stress protein 26
MTIKQKAEKLYKTVNTFILTCVGADDYPLTKAVVPGKHREMIDEMYFCTNTSSKFTAEIVKNPKASVYFYSRKLIWKGCMLKGKMDIVSELAIKKNIGRINSKVDTLRNHTPTQIFVYLNLSPK